MKNLILSMGVAFIAITGLVNQANAQSSGVKIGLKAGATFMTLGSATSNGISINYDYRPGFQVGAFLDAPLSQSISFNPQVVYTQKGGNVNTTISGINLKGHAQVNYIDVPLLFGFKANPKLSFYAGPQVSFLLSQKTVLTVNNSNTVSNTDKTGMKSTMVGGNLGAGYAITDKFDINLHYMFDFGHAAEGANDNGERNSGFILGFGVKF